MREIIRFFLGIIRIPLDLLGFCRHTWKKYKISLRKSELQRSMNQMMADQRIMKRKDLDAKWGGPFHVVWARKQGDKYFLRKEEEELGL